MSSAFVLLTAPGGPFYDYVLRGFAEGFEALGISCLTQNPPPSIFLLADWARKYRPAAVLQINRLLPANVPWPRDVPHLAWLQDHRFDGIDITKTLGAGDHIYLIVHPDSFGVTLKPRWPWSAFRREPSWSILVPGARLNAPAPAELEFKRDYSLTGHLPEPLNQMWPVSYRSRRQPVTLGEFLGGFPMDVLSDASFSMRAIHAAVAERCRVLGCRQIRDRQVLQVFDEILVRTVERRQIAEDLIAAGGTLEIFGSDSWKAWPQFAAFHRGKISDPRELDAVFQTTRVNVHNSGLTMHFRVMDCLAVGGFIVINETPWDDLTGGIHRYLEPGRHYGAYKLKEVGLVARHYLGDAEARRRISAEGHRIVLAEHTWRERARQVMNDVGIAPAEPLRDRRADLQEARDALVRAVALGTEQVGLGA